MNKSRLISDRIQIIGVVHDEMDSPRCGVPTSAGAIGGNGLGGLHSIMDKSEEPHAVLLKLIDERHEALVRRIEESVQQALLGHIEKAMDSIYKMKVSEVSPVKLSMNGDRRNPSSTPASGHAVMPVTRDASSPTKIKPAVESPDSKSGSAGGLTITGDGNKVVEIPNPPSFKNCGSTPRGGKESRNPLEKTEVEGGVLEYDLKLEVCAAKGLHASDKSILGGGHSDPYVKVKYADEGEIYRTQTKKRTLEPEWQESVKFEVFPETDSEVVVEVWDEDKTDQDDFLGRVTLDIAEVRNAGGTIARWFDIDYEDSKKGKLLLKASLKNSSLTDETAYFRLQKWGSEVFNEGPGLDFEVYKSSKGHCLEKVVHSKRFDALFCLMILFNAMVMLVEVEYAGRKAMSTIGLAEPDANQSDAMEWIFSMLNYFFAIVFVIELFLRLFGIGLRFLRKPLNWLDIIIVAGSVVDIIGIGDLVNLTFLRLIRLTKLTRLLKAAMMTSFCEPLRILMNAIAASFGALMWSVILLAMIEILAALFMTQVLADYITDEGRDMETRRFIYTYYGTTSRTALTMFQITMAPGQWSVVGRPLIEKVSPLFAWFFLLYVGGVSFAVVRVISALFLRQTLSASTKDEQLMRNEKVKYKRKYSEGVRTRFNAASVKKPYHLDFESFQKFLKDQDGEKWLDVLELTEKEAVSIFQLVEGDGHLTMDEFLSAVFRLHDATKQIDIVVLQHEAKKLTKQHRHTQAQLADLLYLYKSLSDKITADGASNTAAYLS